MLRVKQKPQILLIIATHHRACILGPAKFITEKQIIVHDYNIDRDRCGRYVNIGHCYNRRSNGQCEQHFITVCIRGSQCVMYYWRLTYDKWLMLHYRQIRMSLFSERTKKLATRYSNNPHNESIAGFMAEYSFWNIHEPMYTGVIHSDYYPVEEYSDDL